MSKLVRCAAIVVGAALTIFSMIVVSSSPSVPVKQRPSAQDLLAARQVWQQLKFTQGKTATEVRVDNRMMSGVSALARDATGVGRIDADLSGGELRAHFSIPLPLGLWLNASASAIGSHAGFPPFRLKVGRLVLPTAAGRLLADLVRSTLRLKGAEIPPLDEVVQSFSIDLEYVVAKVALPSKTGLVDEVIAASSSAISHELVEATFCRIAAEQRAEPVETLSGLVRRTFAEGPEGSPDMYNRASFVALSLGVVGDRAEALFPRAAELRKRCPFPEGPMLLQGRADLAKHWVFSAALTSVLGAQTAGNLGEWKELDDSLPKGSGFSFVDLAADRAGVQTALLALDRQAAAATAKKLSRANDDYMLPKLLLEAPEGLSAASFVRRFGGLERKDYSRAVSHIDQTLAQQRRQLRPN